jgi:hypothetical protein
MEVRDCRTIRSLPLDAKARPAAPGRALHARTALRAALRCRRAKRAPALPLQRIAAGPHLPTFLPHIQAPSGRLFLQNGGQRVATLLVYLNSPASGGRTSFPTLQLSVVPVRGAALLFFPAFSDGRLDSALPTHIVRQPRHSCAPISQMLTQPHFPARTLHAAEPAGAPKYVSQIWLRESGNRRDAEPSRRMHAAHMSMAPAESGSGSEEGDDHGPWPGERRGASELSAVIGALGALGEPEKGSGPPAS